MLLEPLMGITLKFNKLILLNPRMKGAIAICEGMAKNCSIEKLDLSWNGFADEGAAAMGKALKTNSTLKELDLSHNRITKSGAAEVAKGLMVRIHRIHQYTIQILNEQEAH